MRSRNLQVLTAEIRARHPGVVIYGIGDDDHKLRVSDHNEDDSAGVRAAQSDPDSNPEHRAIDVMLGPAFSRADADALIRELLADERTRRRLYYIIFYRRIWSRSWGWAERAKTDDPHPDHIHISGYAPDDENGAPWLTGGDDDMAAADVWGVNIVSPALGGRWAQGQPASEWLKFVVATHNVVAASAAKLDALSAVVEQLAEAIRDGGGTVDTAAILRGVDERLAAHRAAIEADTRDAVADLAEGGAAAVRADG